MADDSIDLTFDTSQVNNAVKSVLDSMQQLGNAIGGIMSKVDQLGGKLESLRGKAQIPATQASQAVQQAGTPAVNRIPPVQATPRPAPSSSGPAGPLPVFNFNPNQPKEMEREVRRLKETIAQLKHEAKTLDLSDAGAVDAWIKKMRNAEVAAQQVGKIKGNQVQTRSVEGAFDVLDKRQRKAARGVETEAYAEDATRTKQASQAQKEFNNALRDVNLTLREKVQAIAAGDAAAVASAKSAIATQRSVLEAEKAKGNVGAGRQLRHLDRTEAIAEARGNAKPPNPVLDAKRDEAKILTQNASLLDHTSKAAVQKFNQEAAAIRAELQALGAKREELLRIDNLVKRVNTKAVKYETDTRDKAKAQAIQAERDKLKEMGNELMHTAKIMDITSQKEVDDWRARHQAYMAYAKDLQQKGIVGKGATRSVEVVEHGLKQRVQTYEQKTTDNKAAKIAAQNAAYVREEVAALTHKGQIIDKTNGTAVRAWMNEAKLLKQNLQAMGAQPAAIRKIEAEMAKMAAMQGKTGLMSKLGSALGPLTAPLVGLASIQGLSKAYDKLREATDEVRRSQIALEGVSKILSIPMGILENQSQRLQKQYGLTIKQANEFSTELAKLAQKAGDMDHLSSSMDAFLNLGAARGLSAEQTLKAVQQALIGLDEGTDKLFNANPSALYQKYAASLGTTAGKLNDMQKAQALLKYGLEAGEKSVGSYAQFLQTATGQMAFFESQTQNTFAKVGMASEELRKGFYGLAGSVMKLAGAHYQLVVPVLAATAAFAAMAYALRAMTIQSYTQAIFGLYNGFIALKGGIWSVNAALTAMGKNNVWGRLLSIALAIGTAVGVMKIVEYQTRHSTAETEAQQKAADFMEYNQEGGGKDKEGNDIPIKITWTKSDDELEAVLLDAKKKVAKRGEELTSEIPRNELVKMTGDQLKARLMKDDDFASYSKIEATYEKAKQGRKDVLKGAAPFTPPIKPGATHKSPLESMLETAAGQQEETLGMSEAALLDYKATLNHATQAQRDFIVGMKSLADLTKYQKGNIDKLNDSMSEIDTGVAGSGAVEKQMREITEAARLSGTTIENAMGPIPELLKRLRLSDKLAPELQAVSKQVVGLSDTFDKLDDTLAAGADGNVEFMAAVRERTEAIADLKAIAESATKAQDDLLKKASNPKVSKPERKNLERAAADRGEEARVANVAANRLAMTTDVATVMEDIRKAYEPGVTYLTDTKKAVQSLNDAIKAGPYGSADLVATNRRLDDAIQQVSKQIADQQMLYSTPATMMYLVMLQNWLEKLQALKKETNEEYVVKIRTEVKDDASKFKEEADKAVRMAEKHIGEINRPRKSPFSYVRDALGRGPITPSDDVVSRIDEKRRKEDAAGAPRDLAAEKVMLDADKHRQQVERMEQDAQKYADIWKQGIEGINQEFTDFFTQLLTTGKGSFREFTIAVLQMISQMIAKLLIAKAIALALGAIGGGGGDAPQVSTTAMDTSTAGYGGSMANIKHDGGLTGEGGRSRGLPRFHSGGLLGNEIPIIAQKGEGVFTAGQMQALGGLVRTPSPPPPVNVAVNVPEAPGTSDGFARAASVEEGMRMLSQSITALTGPLVAAGLKASEEKQPSPFAFAERDNTLRGMFGLPSPDGRPNRGENAPPQVVGANGAVKALAGQMKDSVGASPIQMKNEFSIQALDSRDVGQMLKQHGGTISGIIVDQARTSMAYRRQLLGSG